MQGVLHRLVDWEVDPVRAFLEEFQEEEERARVARGQLWKEV